MLSPNRPELVTNDYLVWFRTHHTCDVKQYCYVGNTAQQCILGLFQDSDLAGDLEDSKSTSSGLLCIFRKSHVRANKLDVQETDFSFTQFYRSWSNVSRRRFTHGWNPRSWSLGFGCRSVAFIAKSSKPHWDMCPEPTKWLLIGCLIESMWTQTFKSNTMTPRTKWQTYSQREISHVMNGIIFCVCSTLAISVLQFVLKWCRKKHKKN